jgi:hypothetical protein
MASKIRAFVKATFGDTVARCLRIDDLPTWYWDQLLALYVLAGKPNCGVRGYAVESILRHYDGSGKRFWRCLLMLPSNVAWRFLRFWWSTKPWWKVKMLALQSFDRASNRLPHPVQEITEDGSPGYPVTGLHKLTPMELPSLPHQPLVSVIVSNYNYATFLGEAIESVLAQTYQHFEIIICDDGSTDNSREVIESFAQQDSRIRSLYKQNGGQPSAWNLAFEASRGDIVCFLDSDDLFQPRKLEKVVAEFASQPRVGILVHPLLPIAAAGKPLGPPYPRDLASGWLATHMDWNDWVPTSAIC